MAGKVKNTEVVQRNIFQNTIESGNKLLTVIDKVLDEFKQLLKISSDLAKSTPLKGYDNIKQKTQALNQAKQAIKGIDSAEKERIAVLNSVIKAEKKSTQEKKQATKIIRDQQRAADALNKQRTKALVNIAKQEQKERDLIAATRLEGKSIDDLNRKNSALVKVRNRLDSSTKKGQKEFKRLTNAIRQNEIQLKRYDKQIGRSQRNVGNYATAIRGVAGALGLTGGIFLFKRAVTALITTFSSYSAISSKVRAISNANDEEFKKLTDSSKALGESTMFTATSVAELQVNLAKLGFSVKEILNAQDAILDLAAATGEDLARSATVAANTIRGFGLDASETTRVADIMTKAFNNSALDLEKFATSMSKVAPVARAFGFSLEDATSLLAKLTDAGFDASTAATSTRNILLNLADANGDLAKALGKPVKTLPDLVKGLKELDERGIDLAKSLELTDKRSVAAFQTFLKGADSLTSFSAALTNSAGEAKRTADIMRDNLAGDALIAQSAIEGLFITIGEKLEPALRAIVKAFTSFIGIIQENGGVIKTFGKVVLVVVSFITAYKVAVLAQNIAVGAYNIVTKIATFLTKAFNAAMKANPIGLVVAALTALVTALLLFNERVTDAVKNQRLWNKIASETSTLLGEETRNLKALFDQLKLTNPETEERRKIIERLNDQYPDLLTNIDLEKAGMQDLLIVYNDYVKQLEVRIKGEVLESRVKEIIATITDLNNQLAESRGREALDLFREIKGFKAQRDSIFKEITFLNNQKEVSLRFAQLSMERNKLEQELNNLLLERFDFEVGIKNTRTDEEKRALLLDRANRIQIARNKLLSVEVELREELKKAGKEAPDFKPTGKTIDELTGAYDALRKELSKNEKKLQDQVTLTEEQRFATAELIKTQKIRLIEIDKEIKSLTALEKSKLKSIGLDQERLKGQLDEEKARKENAKNLTEETSAIESEFAIRRELLVNDSKFKVEKAQDDANKILLINEILKNDLAELEREKSKELEGINSKHADAILDIAKKASADKKKDQKKADDERKKKLADTLETATILTARFFEKQSEARLKAIDKEISDVEKRQARLEDLAARGVEKADENLAFEQKRAAELARNREREIQRQKRIELGLAAVKAYSANVESGEKGALGKTVRDITLLMAFIDALPAFYEGTENTGKGGGQDSKGGFTAILHPNERVMTADQNAKVGDMSNEYLANLALMHRVNPVQKERFDTNKEILEKFDNVVKAIENKPFLSDVTYDKINQSMIYHVQNGTTLEHNHKKLRI